MSDPDWEIPLNLQPDPDDYTYDLMAALRAVVSVRANVPQDAFTAETLGTERIGSGVVIRAPGAPDGLVLTIGYLITEAEAVWLIANDGRAVPGHALAYDQATGFGLVVALGKLDTAGLELGDSDTIKLGDTVVMAAGGGQARAMETKVVARQEFAGYWEYVLDEAIFTAPAHPFWSGAALIGPDGRLVGTGSLILQQGGGAGQRADMNMVVPINLLRPILDKLLTTGVSGQPPRPWLGLFVMENEGGLVVGGMADGGPADRAGIRAGDRILGADDEEITEVSALWRHVWSAGAPGVQVRLQVARDDDALTVRVTTSDRTKFLRTPLMH
jgi:S1-C subfamily serine protease